MQMREPVSLSSLCQTLLIPRAKMHFNTPLTDHRQISFQRNVAQAYNSYLQHT
jgi:hypothetical protein